MEKNASRPKPLHLPPGRRQWQRPWKTNLSIPVATRTMALPHPLKLTATTILSMGKKPREQHTFRIIRLAR
jgi:hypothetical protein